MASIVWDGGTLAGVWAGTPADRLMSFEPAARVVGQRRTLLATGAPRVWAYRVDQIASFELRDLPNTAMETMLALAAHLGGGGIVQVFTDDLLGRHYANCALAPDADVPTPKLADRPLLRYAMAFTLVNLDGDPFVAVYG